MSNPTREAFDPMHREPGVANTLRFLREYRADTRRLRAAGAPGTDIMMMIHESELRGRITINPTQCDGYPCVRGMPIRVADVVDLLGDGLGPSQILQELPDLEVLNVLAAIHYATGDYVEYRKILLRGMAVEELFAQARLHEARPRGLTHQTNLREVPWMRVSAGALRMNESWLHWCSTLT